LTESKTNDTLLTTANDHNVDLSVVIPFFNEEESLPELFDWILRVCTENNLTVEVLAVDDGSTDTGWQVVSDYSQKQQSIKGISLLHNVGKSAALDAGFRASKGKVVITMDADLQDSPDEIPALYNMIVVDGYDMVSGWKKIRHDPASKTIPSKFFNGVTRMVSGIKLHDFNCGLKAYRSNVVKSISLQGEMHRYIPVMAKRLGFRKIGEKIVEHRKRQYGTTKFGLERFANGFLDLLTVTFLSKFGRRPMHFFGSMGVLAFLFGFISAAIIGYEKYKYIKAEVRAPLVTDNPIFYIALTLMLIGVMLFLAGFLGELITRQRPASDHYQIKEVID